MRALVAGLGLIGGSMAKALAQNTDWEVLGLDRDVETLRRALSDGAIHAACLPEDIPCVDLLLVALRPGDAIRYLRYALPRMRPGALAADLCGVKRAVVEAVTPVALEAGVRFVGAHPMAGREVSGYPNADAALFRGASLILTPPDGQPSEATRALEEMALRLGFARAVVTTPEEHDRLIAYTSQLAHTASSAYVMSSAANRHFGFSAGSFRDMTRVARLDPDMWAELFDLNRDMLSAELTGLIARLTELRDALDGRDGARLKALLEAGNRRKLRLIEREGNP
jgi:prephenate dehydrogenase